MKSKYQLSYYMRILVTLVIYAIFYYYIIYSCIHAPSTQAVIAYVIIGILGSVGALFEYIRMSYDKATKCLIVDGKPEETIKLLDRVDKLDFLKSFKTSTQMMRMLAMTDLRKFDELLQYTKNLETKDYDVEIVKKYSEMLAHGELGNKGKSNEAFKQLIQVRDLRTNKGKRYKGAYYFNWEVVNGQHKIYDKEYDSAYRYLNDVNEANMNLREVMHYLIAKAISSKNTGHQDVYDKCKERLTTLCKNNQIMKDYVETI